jgi:hypothetical protein
MPSLQQQLIAVNQLPSPVNPTRNPLTRTPFMNPPPGSLPYAAPELCWRTGGSSSTGANIGSNIGNLNVTQS